MFHFHLNCCRKKFTLKKEQKLHSNKNQFDSKMSEDFSPFSWHKVKIHFLFFISLAKWFLSLFGRKKWTFFFHVTPVYSISLYKYRFSLTLKLFSEILYHTQRDLTCFFFFNLLLKCTFFSGLIFLVWISIFCFYFERNILAVVVVNFGFFFQLLEIRFFWFEKWVRFIQIW